MENMTRITQPSADLINKLFSANNLIEEHFQELGQIFKKQFPEIDNDNVEYNKFNSINKTFLASAKRHI